MPTIRGSLLSPNLPEKWKPKYYIIFFDKEKDDVLISHEEYSSILGVLNQSKFIVIGGETYNTAGISSIIYRYKNDNIPPCPAEMLSRKYNKKTGNYDEMIANQEEIDLWKKIITTRCS